MKYKYRTFLYKFLNLLPSAVGYAIYHFLQEKLSRSTINIKVTEAERSFVVLQNILKSHEITTENKKIAELGSGWVPLLPYLLILKGKAACVDTYDINKHYNAGEINAVNQIYNLTPLDLNITGGFSLVKGVQYFPDQDIANADLANVDLLISRFVLEHVPPAVISSMHRSLHARLPEGAIVLHMISPSDHRAYTDKSLSLVDFLKYSAEQWDNIQTKFDYHNRLRLPQYLNILSEHFDIMYVDNDYSKPGTESYHKFKQVDLHPDFLNYSEEEITAGSINVLMRRKKTSE